MDDKVDFDTLLLENFEAALGLLAGEDNDLQTELCMRYARLKIQLFQRWGRLEDLDDAVEKGERAVAETHKDNRVYA